MAGNVLGYYYLHAESRDLIWKKFQPEEDSPFVQRVWEVDPSRRETAWVILLEGLALGASVSRVRELAGRWKCDPPDAVIFLARHPESNEQRLGLRLYLSEVAGVDPDEWFRWLASTPAGEAPDLSSMPSSPNKGGPA